MSSLRVYFVQHAEGRVSGTLMGHRWRLFEEPPSAYGRDEAEVLAQLEGEVVALESRGPAALNDFLWNERFEMRSARVDVHPHSIVGGMGVVGQRKIPLLVFFAWTRLASGALLVMLPRFGWRFIVEDIAIAGRVIRQTIASSMAGEDPKWIYDYRTDGEEYVRAWKPGPVDRVQPRRSSDDDALPELVSEIADELVDLTALHKMPPRIGVDETLAAHASLFDRDPLPSLLLVGPSGVGKTTFVRALAEHFLAMRRGKRGRRRYVRLWSTSTTRIVAGMAYLGMWQKRCLGVVDELSHEGDYLHLDRLVDVLAPQTDGASIADLFLPAIAAREMSLILECDEAELANARRSNPAFVEQLNLIRFEEMAQGPLLELIDRLAQAEAWVLTDTATRRLVALLGAFRPDQSFPGKAVQLLSWMRATHQRNRKLNTPRAAAELFSQFSGLPVELISDEIPAASETIAARLGQRVVGQAGACRTAARAIARFKAGLNDPDRPVATLFFAGPTGVGKTELAKQLARYMFGDSRRLVRVDMSELMTPGSSQRLLDVSPGVRSLATRVRAEPLTLVLLDEIEKAHAEVFDLLLGVLGEGRMTDARGRLVDFRMSLIVMTSNLGADDARPVGFSSDGPRRQRDRRASVERHFRPELVARLDEVVSFRSLERDDMERIVDLLVGQLQTREGIQRRRIRLSLSDGARSRLATLGFHPELGARPLARVIEERVVTPLAARLAAQPDYAGRDVRIVDGTPRGDEIGV